MQLKLNFKDVGQGDTIFLQWRENEQSSYRFGLIDCNLVKYKIDCVIEHISTQKIKEFDFVIMTHPHSDHCSGFYFFLNYCEENNIVIKQFIHTAPFDATYMSTILGGKIGKLSYEEILTKPVNRRVHKTLLWNLFVKLRKSVSPANFIKSCKILNADSAEIPLTNTVSLKLLSPLSAYGELTSFLEKTYGAEKEEKLRITKKCENNPHANYLSSLIQIYCKKPSWKILLFSDVTADTLTRLLESEESIQMLNSGKLLLFQIPHHGSKKNHVEDFWNSFQHLKNSKAVISVGEGYGHPDSPVIKYFHERCSEIHSTNYVGGYRRFFNHLVPSAQIGRRTSLFNLPHVGITGKRTYQGNPSIPKCGEKCVEVFVENGQYDCRVIEA